METNIDSKKFNIIVEDIIDKVSKETLKDEDLNNIKIQIKKEIMKKSYTYSELSTVVDALKKNIDKVKFSKNDIRAAADKAKSSILLLNKTLSSLQELTSLPIKKQITVVSKLIYRTFIRILDDIILLLVTVFIVLNLYFRSNVPGTLLYPSNANEFPYVYFDENSRSKQSNLTSCVETNTKDMEDDVFLDTPAYFTSDGKYVIDKNICKINDPFGISDKGDKSKCSVKVDDLEFAKYFGKNINYNNLSFFSKRFIENNNLKKSDDLTIYGMLTYVMLFTTINTNSYLSSLSDFSKQFLPYSNKNKSLVKQGIFLLLTMILYSLFKTNKNGFKKFIEKLLPDNLGPVYSLLDIISGIFAPFITFFKLLFLIIYPLILFSSIFAFINYSSYVNSILSKLFAYFGVANSMVTLLVFVLMMLNVFAKKGGQFRKLDDVFDNLIGDFIGIIKMGINKLKAFITPMDRDNKKVGKGASGKGKGKGSGGLNNVSCKTPSLFSNFSLSKLLGLLLGLLIGPILIILFMLPFITTLPLTFNMSKGMGLDFMNYFKKIICMMGEYKIVIRLMMYIIIVLEIIKYMKKKFAIITGGTLIIIILIDLMKDFIKQLINKNGCNIEDNGLNIGEKISDLLMTNNMNNIK